MTTDATGLREAAEKYSDPSFLAEIRAHADHLGAKHRLPATRQVIVDLVDAVDGFAQHYLATHPSDGGEAISEEWLREIGFEVDAHGQLRIARHWKHSPYPTYLILSDPPNILDSPWSLQTYFDDGSWEGTMIAEEITTRDDLRHLLAALGCETKGTDNA